MNPKVLLVATERWCPTARLVVALRRAGCDVDVLCPVGHPVGKTGAAARLWDYNGLMPLRSVARAIAAADPDLVIPADDLATRHLHSLHQRNRERAASGNKMCALIERSLGAARSFEVLEARSAFIEMAREEGIRAPRTEVIAGREELATWIAQTGFPFVLKANATSGGDGVSVVKTVAEAEQAFRKLQAPPLFARAIKHAAVDRDLTLLWPSLSRQRHVVNAQEFVDGHEATSAIACWNGEVLAGLHFEVIEKARSNGHATVVRAIAHEEMSAAAQKIARRLELSGFYGLDFMLESGTGAAHLIEINPRTTQVGHLALGPKANLPAALYSALTGTRVDSARAVTAKDTIALFPQEWKRDPASPFLVSAYHDVPWDEPKLIEACVGAVSFPLRKPAQSAAAAPDRVNAAVEKESLSSSAGD